MPLPIRLTRTYSVSLCFLILVCGCSSHRTAQVVGREIVPSGQTSFASQKHGFSVWLPTAPTQSQKKLKTRVGTQYFFKSTYQAVTYGASVSPSTSATAVWETELDEMQHGMVLVRNAKLKRRERVQQNGFPGRDIEVELDNGAVIFRSRFYATRKGVYSISAGGYRDSMRQQTAQINRVFDSFRIDTQ